MCLGRMKLMTAGQYKQYPDPKTEAATHNSAIKYALGFPVLNSFSEK